MCGICGIVNYKDGIISPGTLEKMNAILVKRGPDDEGIHVDYAGLNTSAAIAMRRLSVIDLETGHQPIFNEDHTMAIVSNGEIYNYRELRKELEDKKHIFYTRSDTEVILHLYEEYGAESLKRLRGMFAFAIWDSPAKSLFAARDRMGQKPLYYAFINESFYFASELKAFEKIPAFKKKVSLKAIDRFLLYQYIPSPLTIWEDVFKLPAGNFLKLETPGTLSVAPYWDISFVPKTQLKYKDAKEKLRELLLESVKYRMIADVDLGAFLSGGIDSSIIVALMSGISSKPVKTFSVGFTDQKFSELKYARQVANKYSTEHHEFIVKPEFMKILPEIIRNHDQPFADPSALPSHYLTKMAASEVKVALNGDAGDENFAGYLRHKALSYSRYLSMPAKFIPGFLLDFAAENIHNPYLHKVISRHIKPLKSSPAGRNTLWHAYISKDLRRSLYSEKMLDTFHREEAESYLTDIFNNAPAFSIIDRSLYADLRAYLPEALTVKMDIASMSNSLETRSPFLDHNLIEFAASLPDGWKLKGKTSKYILKDTFGDLLPPGILKRPKQGFGLPISRWFREEESVYIRDILLSERALSRGYFKPEALRRLVDAHTSGKADYAYPLWALLILELWHREVLD